MSADDSSSSVAFADAAPAQAQSDQLEARQEIKYVSSHSCLRFGAHDPRHRKQKPSARVVLPEDDGQHVLKPERDVSLAAPVHNDSQDTDEEGEEDEGDDEEGAEGDFLADFPDETDVRVS